MRYPPLKHWLLLVALVMRFAVPGGFMLDPAGAAGLSLIACEGQGPTLIVPTLAKPDGAGGHHHQTASHQDCPYSPAAAAGDLPSAASFHLPVAPPSSLTGLAAETSIKARDPSRLLPPSTGPPLVA